jgi:thiol-disulfide isomerase/thioredoxin
MAQVLSVRAYVFSSPTCAPCKTLKPVINDLKEEFESVEWVDVNIRDDPNNYTGFFQVSRVPTIVVVVMDSAQKIMYSEQNSGTDVKSYYRILRNCMNRSRIIT